MDATIMVILREIQLECHRQIGIERRGGRAIKEEELQPYPQRCDFDGAVLPGSTLVQLVESTEAEDPQMTVDEAIDNAEKDNKPQSCAQENIPRSKVGAWLEAVRAWHYDRKEKEYKYACAKQRAEDRTYGFEYISDFIDKYIARLERDSENSTNGQVF